MKRLLFTTTATLLFATQAFADGKVTKVPVERPAKVAGCTITSWPGSIFDVDVNGKNCPPTATENRIGDGAAVVGFGILLHGMTGGAPILGGL